MTYNFVLYLTSFTFLFMLGSSVIKAVKTLKMRRELNKQKDLELAILEKREALLKEGKKVSENLEELLYKAQLQKENDDIMSNRD